MSAGSGQTVSAGRLAAIAGTLSAATAFACVAAHSHAFGLGRLPGPLGTAATLLLRLPVDGLIRSCHPTAVGLQCGQSEERGQIAFCNFAVA
jgi:hypothetical protein